MDTMRNKTNNTATTVRSALYHQLAGAPPPPHTSRRVGCDTNKQCKQLPLRALNPAEPMQCCRVQLGKPTSIAIDSPLKPLLNMAVNSLLEDLRKEGGCPW